MLALDSLLHRAPARPAGAARATARGSDTPRTLGAVAFDAAVLLVIALVPVLEALRFVLEAAFRPARR